jgi:molybdopterin molybdotransferase
MVTMISTSEALEIIKKNVVRMPATTLPLNASTGLTLAEDVYALIDIPAFPQSSMDGYAFCFDDWKEHGELVVEGMMAAGDSKPVAISKQQAMRIFTGAPVPPGADTVVMQEKIRIENGRLFIEDEKIMPGTNVRPMGSEIKAGSLALSKGNTLTPAAIGFLAGIGIGEVSVIPHPSISIIVTGNELQQPGNQLEYGQVYESNSFALTAALHQLHITDVTIQKVHDDPDAVTAILHHALQNSDIVLLTGGISVGDYDFVLQAVDRCGVSALFHKVKQRPGKPLYFGKKGEKIIFGLPGNPASVLTCFYRYVITAMEQLSGHDFGLHSIKAPLGKSYRKVAGLTHFLKGTFDGQMATPLDAQESYRMQSFARAGCLIELEEEEVECREGSMVTIHLLPV